MKIILQYFMFSLLTDWFAQKNLEDTVIFVTIFITGTNQVCSITDYSGGSNTEQVRYSDGP